MSSGHRLPGVRGELLAWAGHRDDARTELARAVAACTNDAERRHLEQRLDALRI